jgi:murein DD-endopeptidase MepM/ murein hydrolase activator NlpD
LAYSEPIEASSIEVPVVLTTEQSTQYPVKEVKITQGYRFYHPGIDLDGATGNPIKPIMGGVVERTEYSRFDYGKSVVISHGGGIESRYAHLSKIDVFVGEEVSKETKLGEMGATGRAFGDHLHLEVYQDGKPINPLSVLPK